MANIANSPSMSKLPTASAGLWVKPPTMKKTRDIMHNSTLSEKRIVPLVTHLYSIQEPTLNNAICKVLRVVIGFNTYPMIPIASIAKQALFG